MVYCTICGKEIKKVPAWLASVKIDFVCCKDKELRSITQINPDELQPHSVRSEASDLAAVDALDDEDEED
jgi:hypothetical protein